MHSDIYLVENDFVDMSSRLSNSPLAYNLKWMAEKAVGRADTTPPFPIHKHYC